MEMDIRMIKVWRKQKQEVDGLMTSNEKMASYLCFLLEMERIFFLEVESYEHL